MSEPQANAPSPRPIPWRASWFADFDIGGGRLKVRDTGADLALDWTLISEGLIWLPHHLMVRFRSWWLRLFRPNALRIWFTPRTPRPWYMIWTAMAWAGLRIARSPEEADAAFSFEDSTWCATQAPPMASSFNFGCTDVSKSRVAAVFEAVFGYPLAVDPHTWTGPAVEKSERNGAHDGRIVQCPITPAPEMHYQRVVDSSDGGFAYDLRTHCIGRRPRVVWIKKKPAGDRFSIHNLGVTVARPEAVFSADELAAIGRFLVAMACDWAGLDILRDAQSGRIYIVDVNKTDVGPIIALSWRDKLRSAGLLAAALVETIEDDRSRAT